MVNSFSNLFFMKGGRALANSNNVKFFFTSDKKRYDALVQKDPLSLYFIEDAETGYKALYKGANLIAVGSDATSTISGLMSADDKKKLDELLAMPKVVGDDKSISVNDGIVKITGIDEATAGSVLTKAEDGSVEWKTVDVSSVKSVNGKTGDVVLTASDIITNSTDANKISVAADGTLEVNSLTFDKLIQNESDKLVISGGNA
nr:MAG TPA: hypothetical protein [Bacteriophage sp.]